MGVEKKLQILLLAGLLFLYALLVTQKINLVTADLGRHLKNGEVIISALASKGHLFRAWKNVLETNFYSYTYSSYPFLNHHWGSGVIFYLVYRVFGFVGISLLFSLLTLLTFYLFFRVAERAAGFNVTMIVSLFLLPVLASRIEIRPEVFSYLFCGLFLWILGEVREGRLVKKWLWLLPVLELLWVNLHIYFFLGIFLIGVFFLEELFLLLKRGKFLSNLSYLGGILFLSVFVSLLNPAGLKGVLYPLYIFQGYGYRLFENQTVWFLDKIVPYPPNLFFKISFGLLVISWIYSLLVRKRISFCYLLFTILFSYLGWTAVRNFTLFGYFMIPVVAGNIGRIRSHKDPSSGEGEKALRIFVTASLAVLVIFGLFLLNPGYWIGKISVGVGLQNGNNLAAEFFLKNNLSGPIFNNYDNGGYLIFYLYPKEKVFVDNRPEAYPAEFFQKTYIPMQEGKDKWDEEDKKYNFNTIFFHRNDLTPWAQTFLVSRIADPSWAPVYVDDWSIIFVKRNETNKRLISKYELPKEMFTISR